MINFTLHKRFKNFLVLFFFLFSAALSAQENCTNGIDDDSDGLIDLNDPDCICNTTPIPSIIPNPSFETYSSCPESFSELHKAIPWIQATDATSDFFNCTFSFPGMPEAGLTDYPDGNGAAGGYFVKDWNEYLGATLLSPMLAGTNYQLTFNISAITMSGGAGSPAPIDSFEPVEVTLYGCANGTNLPLSTVFSPSIVDPTWLVIGSVVYSPQSVWSQVTINFTPAINVNAIMLGSPPTLPASYPSLMDGTYVYMIYDNLLLNNSSVFGVIVSQTGLFCDSNLVLTATITDSEITSPTYQWYKDGIAISGATGAAYNVPPGTSNIGNYNVRVKSGTECFISSDITISSIVPSPATTNVQPTCLITTGNITVTTVATEYSKDNGVTWQTSPVFNNLAVGTYQIKTKTASGCISAAATVNILFPPSNIWPNFENTSSTCTVGGTITVLTPASQYSFDNGVTWSTNPTITGLAAGTYLIRVKDSAGCVSNSSYCDIYEIFADPPQFTSIQPTCGTGGSITITTPAAEYSFDNGLTWGTNPTATNLVPGNYFLKTKDANGCLSYETYTYLNEFYLDPATYTLTHPNCGQGGSITITSIGAGAQYSIDGGTTWSSNPVFTGLLEAPYTIVIKNALGCQSYPSYDYLYEQGYIDAPTFTSIDISCTTAGTITITTPAAQYSFDGGATWTTNPTATNLSAGYYYLQIINAAGCYSYTNYAYINSSLLPAPQYSLVQPLCPTGTGTGISITITTPAAEYSFDDGATWTTNPTAENLAPNNYYFIKIKNTDGCISYTEYVAVGSQNTAPNAPIVTTTQPVNCTTSAGIITVTTSAYQYSFDNGATWVTNPVASNLQSGSYSVRIKATNGGCMSNATTVVINAPQDAPLPPSVSTVQPSSCANAFGTITVTSSASSYSFDNGLTYSTNAVSGPLAPGTYHVKVKNAANCESDAVAVVINAPTDYPPAPSFTVIQPDCFNPNGTVTIQTAATEYSFDNGVTWITNAALGNLAPGSYSLKIKNAMGCISNQSTALITPFTSFTPVPTAVSPQVFCIQANSTLGNIIVNGQNIIWYDTLTGGSILPSSAIVNSTIYYVSQTIGGCESLRLPVTITVQNTPAPAGLSPQMFCASQNATLSNLIINGSSIKFYNHAAGGTVLPVSTLLADNTTYYVSQTVNGCESVNRLPVTISMINSLPSQNFAALVCDDLNDGEENVDLRIYEGDIITNPTAYTFSYYTSFSGAENGLTTDLITNYDDYPLVNNQETIYVRVNFNNMCHSVAELMLTLIDSPYINMKDLYDLCENGSIKITADPGFDSYTWSTGAISQSILVNQAGNYSVTVTKNHGTVICTSTKDLTVNLSNRATITNIETVDWTAGENTITVFVDGLGDYEYSLDGINFQSSNQFYGLENGEYTVYVNDIKGCGVSKQDVYLLMYPKFFTPNGDSYNDTWGIKFSKNEPNLKVRIFDRYGKFIKELTDTEPSWDGIYNGALLPSTDYWFMVIRESGKEHRGHFSMKR